MSKESYCFQNESGETAFLAGVADTLSDDVLCRVCPLHSTVEVDVFYLGENNEIDFNSAIKKRLNKYLPSIENGDSKLKTKVDSLDIQFEVADGYKNFQTPRFIMDLFQMMPEYSHAQEQHNAYCKFSDAIEVYLGKPLRFFKAHKDYSVLSEFYLYICYSVVFIEYNEYLLMIMAGSSE